MVGKIPGVLSFKRRLAVTDGLFYNQYPDGNTSSLLVVRHGIRGTQNVNKFEPLETSTRKSSTRQQVTNIQTIDSAKLDPHAEGLLIRFACKALEVNTASCSCALGKNDSLAVIHEFRHCLNEFFDRAKTKEAFFTLALRYARNIANGRFLWRNREMAEEILVSVNGTVFQALDFPLTSFDSPTQEEEALAKSIAQGFTGEERCSLTVEASLRFGLQGSFEVFPSQNFLEKKDKGFSRSLYALGGQAAFRDQKIANALRTIDTWYPQFAELQRPIPVEPNGANIEEASFFRNTKDSSAFHALQHLDSLTPDSDEGLFFLACCIRGGVFSTSTGE